MKQNNKNYELNYPEILSNILLLNIPTAFYVIFELFKPFMPKKTLEKFTILDSSPPRWRTALLKKVPADVLPRKYGGLRTTPTKDFMTGKEIPVSFDEDDEESEGNHGKLIELLIDARDSLSIQVTIQKKQTPLLTSYSERMIMILDLRSRMKRVRKFIRIKSKDQMLSRSLSR